MTERDFAVSVVKTLQAAGHEALWAGGCVRDELLGLNPQDYDIATSARPEQVQKLFRRTVAVGASFGVIEILGPHVSGRFLKVQAATYRTDGEYGDGRRPDQVVFASAQEDARRRDFTINGMFFDPIQERLIDYVDGQTDLRSKILRAIGDPTQRFTEDKLRLLRGVRIATRFNLTIEPATFAAMIRLAPTITVVSVERIAEELRLLLVHPRRAAGVDLLFEAGLVAPLLPQLLPMRGLPQGPPAAPVGDLWYHVLRVLELLGPKVSFPLALAALLHDVGKPRVAGRTADKYTFYHHEQVGGRIAADICLLLKLANQERERVVWLVEKHQYLADARQLRPSKLKSVLHHPGIHELLALHRADALATGKSLDHVAFCESRLADWTEADLNPPPLVTGNDLLAMGLPRGPLFKIILDAVREAQLDGTAATTAEGLALARQLAEQPSAATPSPSGSLTDR